MSGPRHTLVAIVAGLLCIPALGAPREFAFTTGDGFEFRGVIDSPTAGATPQYAVLMLGGGLANDLDWSVPASLTINGQPHADGPRISRALTDAGFLTARWSTIRVGDPKADKWPDEVTPYTYAQTLEQAKAALAGLRAQRLVPDDHIILLGHSLGARRALNICAEDKTIAAVVCLSAADIAPTGYEGQAGKQELRGEAGRIHAEMDRTGDGRVEPWEFQSWAPVRGADGEPRAADAEIPTGENAFAFLDADADGVLRRWEIEAQLALVARRGARAALFEADPKGLPWGEDALVAGRRSLLLYGSLDAWAAQGAVLRERAANPSAPKALTIRFLPGLGHQLGEEREGKVGPIDPAALAAITEWLKNR